MFGARQQLSPTRTSPRLHWSACHLIEVGSSFGTYAESWESLGLGPATVVCPDNTSRDLHRLLSPPRGALGPSDIDTFIQQERRSQDKYAIVVHAAAVGHARLRSLLLKLCECLSVEYALIDASLHADIEPIRGVFPQEWQWLQQNTRASDWGASTHRLCSIWLGSRTPTEGVTELFPAPLRAPGSMLPSL